MSTQQTPGREPGSQPGTFKIPQHNTPRGTWCRFSGMDSYSGICRMCEPEDETNDGRPAEQCPECLAPAGEPCASWCTGSMPAAPGWDDREPGTMSCVHHGAVPYEHMCRAPGEAPGQFAKRASGEWRDV